MKGLLCLILLSLPLFFQECQKKEVDSQREALVATAGGHVLYLDELQAALPQFINEEDSIQAAKLFIDTWVKQHLTYEAAEKNLQASEELNKMVEDYRMALMIYEYQEQVLLEKLKTEVSDEDIAAYYESNKQRFISSQNLIKGIFIKLPVHSAQLKKFKALYRKSDTRSMEDLDLLCLQYADTYDNFRSEWIRLDDVMDNIPSNLSDQTKFLKSKDFLEVEDDNFCYLLKIDEYLLAGHPEPLEFVNKRIKNIIINSQKTTFLRQLEEEMKREAEQKGQIIYY